jgi:hypothetical protein
MVNDCLVAELTAFYRPLEMVSEIFVWVRFMKIKIRMIEIAARIPKTKNL